MEFKEYKDKGPAPLEGLREKIRRRKSEGATQIAVAKELGYDRSTIARYWHDPGDFEHVSELAPLERSIDTKHNFDVGKIKRLAGTVATRFLYHPIRIGPVLQRFYAAALTDNKVLLKYMDYLLPQQQQGNIGVVVKVETNIEHDPRKKYSLEGKVIDEA